MSSPSPVCCVPWLRPMPWGGQRLTRLLQLPAAPEPIGEAWLFSDHRLHSSQTTSTPAVPLGEYLRGETVPDVTTQFPLLVKLLDAQQNLSIQVHPNAELARVWAPDEGSKTEAWVVLETSADAAIYLGLKPGIDLATFHRELQAGNAALCLNRFTPVVGETYFVPAGTVHALGQGMVVLEVQQTSDATFRLYDWGRVDAAGRSRDLHWDAGLACTVISNKRAGRVVPKRVTDGVEELITCDDFSIHRWRHTAWAKITAPAILIPLEADGLKVSDNPWLRHGHATYLPSNLGEITIPLSPDTTLFEIHWPQ